MKIGMTVKLAESFDRVAEAHLNALMDALIETAFEAEAYVKTLNKHRCKKPPLRELSLGLARFPPGEKPSRKSEPVPSTEFGFPRVAKK